jgi:hypothetical protein
MPALLTSTSSRPGSAPTAATAASMLTGSPTSSSSSIAPPPISVANRSALPTSRALTITR